MLPATAIDPHILLVTGNALKHHVSIVSIASVQRRLCGDWSGRNRRKLEEYRQTVRQRHECLARYRARNSHLIQLHENEIRRLHDARDPKAKYDTRYTSTNPKLHGNNREDVRNEMMETMKRMREDMNKTRQEILKKWLDRDPYDVLFGWSNRLRNGIKPNRWIDEEFKKAWETTESMTKEAAKKFESMTENITQTVDTAPKEKSSSKTLSAESNATVHSNLSTTKLHPVTSPQSKEESSHSTFPKRVEISDQTLLEYDPISNRMVQKSDKAFSHYGQDLDTETGIPFKPSQRAKSSSISTPIASANPAVSEVLTELELSKPRNVIPEINPATRKENILSVDASKPLSLDRNDLEKSFNQLHASSGEPIRETFGSASRMKELSDRFQLHPKKIDTSSNAPSAIPDSAIANQPPSSDKYKLIPKSEGLVKSDAETSHPGYVKRVKKDNEIRRSNIERIQGEINDLNQAISSLKPGSLQRSLKLQRHGLAQVVENIEKTIEPIYPFRLWDQGRNKLQPQPIPMEDVFPMVFGDKPSKSPSKVQASDPKTKLLEEEVQRQKEAMKLAEETRLHQEKEPIVAQTSPKKDDRHTHDQLVDNIRDIYEQNYGRISDFLPRAEPIEIKQPVVKDFVVSQPPVEAEGTSEPLNRTTTVDEIPALASTTTTSENAEYTILAYDPSTNEVSTTTLSAPTSATDKPVPITVALTELNEPAKFLPHLRLLGNRGTAVSVTKNLLVLRTSPTSDLQSVTVKSTPETAPEIQTKDSTSDALQKQNNPYKEAWKRAVPRRTERVFSGRRHERWSHNRYMNRRRRGRWFWRLLTLSSFGAAVLYVAGLTAGLRKVEVPKSIEE